MRAFFGHRQYPRSPMSHLLSLLFLARRSQTVIAAMSSFSVTCGEAVLIVIEPLIRPAGIFGL